MRGKKPKRTQQPKRKRALAPGKALERKTPLRAKKGLSSGTAGLARSKGLKRTGIKRSSGKATGGTFGRMPADWVAPWNAWKRKVIAVGYCAVCGRGPNSPDPAKRVPVTLDPHHVVPARFIRSKLAFKRRLEGEKAWNEALKLWLFDTRNGLCLCRDCHASFEDGADVIPRALIPESVFVFAAEIGLTRRLDLLYPIP